MQSLDCYSTKHMSKLMKMISYGEILYGVRHLCNSIVRFDGNALSTGRRRVSFHIQLCKGLLEGIEVSERCYFLFSGHSAQSSKTCYQLCIIRVMSHSKPLGFNNQHCCWMCIVINETQFCYLLGTKYSDLPLEKFMH